MLNDGQLRLSSLGSNFGSGFEVHLSGVGFSEGRATVRDSMVDRLMVVGQGSWA